jgi:hypothetical protein
MSANYNTLIGSSQGPAMRSTATASSGELSMGNTKVFPFDEMHEITRDKVLTRTALVAPGTRRSSYHVSKI